MSAVSRTGVSLPLPTTDTNYKDKFLRSAICHSHKLARYPILKNPWSQLAGEIINKLNMLIYRNLIPQKFSYYYYYSQHAILIILLLCLLSYLWGPLLLAAVSYFLIHFSQSGDSPPGSFDPSPWISSSRTDGNPMTDLINWMASM